MARKPEEDWFEGIEVEWPDPQEDPEEEPVEPWARRVEERLDRWKGWDAGVDEKSNPEP